MKISKTLLVAVVALAILGTHGDRERTASAAWPPQEGDDLTQRANQPNDPSYPGQWNYFSYIPPAVQFLSRFTEYEKMIGSGFHADRAWIITTGDPRILIGEIDSGIEWANSDDLTNKFFLNRGELPEPEVACRTGAFNAADPYDANGDGKFNIQDYSMQSGTELPTVACDSRVMDRNGSSFLDPEDLILSPTFSDGTDGDNNGYVDDISGWDFFENDNNPRDDVFFGHGTGEARDSTAQANNGRGQAGTCPECTVMMLRAGDSFIVGGVDWGMSVIYATDMGASIAQSAIESLSQGRLAREALKYAHDNGTVVVASAADQNSFQHSTPGTNNYAWYVHAIRYDSDGIESASTFNAFNNCTNYGAQLAVSISGNACSSEAVGRGSGLMGLLYSYALEQDVPFPDGAKYPTDPKGARRLSSNEVIQLMNMNVNDVYDPNLDTDAKALARDAYLTKIGWEQRFGYGRVNARKALDELVKGRIPPVVEITSPRWFETLDPASTPKIEIQGSITFRTDRYQSYDYVVEWAKGVEPNDSDFKPLAMGSADTTQRKDAVLAMLDAATLAPEGINEPPMPEPDAEVNRHMVTVRVRVTTHSTDAMKDGVKGEARRAFHIHRDPTVLPGFPKKVLGSFEGTAKLADLNGDRKREAVIIDSEGLVHAYQADGSELAGWPAKLNPYPAMKMGDPKSHRAARAFNAGGVNGDITSPVVINSPAIGDIDGDQKLDVVASSYDGFLFVYNADGSVRAGFPVEVDRTPRTSGMDSRDNLLDDSFNNSPALYDLDKDGKLEIIQAGGEGSIYVWKADGSKMAGYPKLLKDGNQQRRIVSSPAIGDLNGDGNADILATTTESYDGDSFGRAYAFTATTGAYLPGFPLRIRSTRVLPMVGEGLPNNPAMADIDGDGKDEWTISGIASKPNVYSETPMHRSYVELANNQYGAKSNSDDIPSITLIANPAFGDMDNDGSVDMIQPGAGFGAAKAFAGSGKRENFDHHLNAWTLKGGSIFPGFPHRMDDWQFFMNPAVVDVDGDGKVEAIAGSGGYYVRAVDKDGKVPAGWPKFTGQWLTGSPSFGDMDGDGKLEMVIGTRSGFLYAFHTEGKVDGRVDWWTYAHDNWNTNNYGTPREFGKAGKGGGGGGCEVVPVVPTSTALGMGILIVLMMGITALLRRSAR